MFFITILTFETTWIKNIISPVTLFSQESCWYSFVNIAQTICTSGSKVGGIKKIYSVICSESSNYSYSSFDLKFSNLKDSKFCEISKGAAFTPHFPVVLFRYLSVIGLLCTQYQVLCILIQISGFASCVYLSTYW